MSELLAKPNAVVIKELYFSRRNLFVLRIVSWDGKSPVVEKRKLYVDNETKEMRHGRVMGFNKYDLEFLKQNWEEIASIIREHESTHKEALRSGRWSIREVGKIENA